MFKKYNFVELFNPVVLFGFNPHITADFTVHNGIINLSIDKQNKKLNYTRIRVICKHITSIHFSSLLYLFL